MRRRNSSASWRASVGPGDQAQDHRPGLHRGLRPRGRQDRGRRIPGPGHALSRRDRERLVVQRQAHVIKSHHNVGGLPDYMKLKLVEPLRELFKDEVRALGRELGLTDAFVGRHPFPGPGLAIRIPGEITPRRRSRPCNRPTPSIWTRSARPASTTASGRPSPSCCRSRRSGVMGDARTYEKVLALRAVTSTDGMTADFFEFPWDVLGKLRHPDRQRGPGRQPRRLRRDLQAARHDRVGIVVGAKRGGVSLQA